MTRVSKVPPYSTKMHEAMLYMAHLAKVRCTWGGYPPIPWPVFKMIENNPIQKQIVNVCVQVQDKNKEVRVEAD